MVSPDSSATESSNDEYEIFFSNRSARSHKKHPISPSSGSSVESSSDGTEETSTPSKPSAPSALVKRPRVAEENEATKSSPIKTKVIQMGEKENKSSGIAERKKTAVREAEKSAKKTGRIWNPKDEAAFLNELVACIEKSNGLPRNMLPVYDQIRSKLDGDYTTNQLYDKQRGLRTKLGKFRDKVMDKGFSFKNDHEKTLYKLSMKLWGKEEEDGSGDQKIGKKTREKVGERQKGKQHVRECEGEEREEVRRKPVKEGEGEEREGVKRKLVKDFEVEEIEEAKRKHVKDGEGKAREGLKDGGEAKGKLVKNDQGKEREEVKRKLAKDVEGEGKEEVRKKGGEPVQMSQKEQDEEDGDSDEDNGEEEEVDGEANGNVNLTQHGNPNQSRTMGWNQRAFDGSRKIATVDQHDAGGNVVVHDLNGSGNFASDDERKLVDLVHCKTRDLIDCLKSEIMKMVNTALQGLSNTSIDANLKFPINERFSSAREYPALSNSEVEMLDQKWKAQQFVELDANSKHLALLLEENQLRMTKLQS